MYQWQRSNTEGGIYTNISGATASTYTLTAGTLNPSEATAVYQWRRSNTESGTYTNISGTTSNTYTLIGSDYNKYVKVRVTGSGSYTGTVNSAAVGPMSAGVISAIGNISGDPVTGETLTAGSLSPVEATATYRRTVYSALRIFLCQNSVRI